MDAVVEAVGLEQRYGDVLALDGVDLSIDRGEIYGLIGPNGAGKTTLARALLGTIDPDGGRVRLFGQPPDRTPPGRIGYLPQSFDPHDRLTPTELLAYYGGLAADALDPATVLETVGIDPDTDRRYAALSGGERRRVCLGTALVADPDLLVVDEPTTGIDPEGRRSILSLFEALCEEGTTIVLSTHDMRAAERVADRVGMLADGRLVAEDDPAALIAAHGGQSQLEIETDAPPAAIDRPSVARTDAGLRFTGVDPTAIGAIVDGLTASDYRVDRLTWRDPDLEDAYLELAGEDRPAEASR